jgi:predicted Zn-dependent peptidase
MFFISHNPSQRAATAGLSLVSALIAIAIMTAVFFALFSTLQKIIDLVSDIYFNPIFPEKDINIEKGVIKDEINMYKDLPQQTVWEVWDKLLYGDQPAGRTILGPKENIDSFKQKDLYVNIRLLINYF